jgi:hypothetical protein
LSVVDPENYMAVPSRSLAEQLLLAARDRIFRDFIACMRPNLRDEILDVGASDAIDDGGNLLDRKYQYQEKITACGLGAGRDGKSDPDDANKG